MFENIITKKEVKFKDLEEKFFKLACSMVNEMFKVVLEKYDEEIMNTRDSNRFRHKGKVGTSIKTKTGLIEYERVKYIEKKEDGVLEKGTKETPAIFKEADGIMIVMQGTDRQKRINEFKRNHPNEEVPKKVRNGELKLGMTYEGWKEEGKNRYKLIGKEYVAGFMDGEKIAEIMRTKVYSKYDVSKIELNVTNSDGANWIKKLVPKNGIYQADCYHLKEKIITNVREKEDAEEIRKIIYTTNPIESLNSALRKVTRGKGSFINEMALMKVLFLRVENLQKKWCKGTQNWRNVQNQLGILFGERYTKYII